MTQTTPDDRQALRAARYREADTRRLRRWAILATTVSGLAFAACVSVVGGGITLGVVSWARGWDTDYGGLVGVLVLASVLASMIAASTLQDHKEDLVKRFANHRAAKRALLDEKDRHEMSDMNCEEA